MLELCRGNYQKASEWLAAADKSDHGQGGRLAGIIAYNRGVAATRLGQLGEAVRHFELAAKDEGGTCRAIDSHYAWGVVEYGMGQYDEAVKQLEMAREDPRSSSRIEIALALANARARNGDADGALRELKPIADGPEANPRASLLRATLHAANRNWDLAYRDCKRTADADAISVATRGEATRLMSHIQRERERKGEHEQ